jgi:hypothetical protein
MMRWPRSSESKLRLWKICGWVTVLLFLVVGGYWFFAIPTPGKGGLLLAVGATLMPLFWEKMRVPGKMAFVAMLFLLLAVEYRAIDKEHAEAAKAQAEVAKAQQEALKQIGTGFAVVLKTEQDNYTNATAASQGQFAETIRELLKSERDEREQFGGLLSKQNDLLTKQGELYEHEGQLAESLHGRLAPGSDPTPPNACHAVSGGEVLIMWGNTGQSLNADVVTRFPHTVIMSHKYGPVLTFDRDGSSIIAVLDLRSSDGRIVAQLNRDGWVVNRNKVLEATTTQNSLSVIDDFGVDVISVKYFNPHAISVSGSSIGFATIFGNCMRSDGANIGIP